MGPVAQLFSGLFRESPSGRQLAEGNEVWAILHKDHEVLKPGHNTAVKMRKQKKSLIWLINSTLASYTWFTNFLVTTANIFISAPSQLATQFLDFLLSTYNCWVITKWNLIPKKTREGTPHANINYTRYLKDKLKITLGVSEMSHPLKNIVNESFLNFRQSLFIEFETFN